MRNGKNVVHGVEGNNLTIVCIVGSGSPPVETLVLNINGTNITNEGSDRIAYSFIPTKLDNMKLFTCSAYSSLLMNQLSCKVRLDIQYSPVIDIRRKLTKTKIIITCYPSGNPANYTFGDWEHWSEFDEHIRNVHGTSGGTLIMKYTTDNKLDEIVGVCKCKTSNDRPEPPTNMSVIPFERHLTVMWYRGYNGGFPQTFFIQYRQEKKEIGRRSDPVIDNMQARISNILPNLSPQTRYLVRVLSTNAIGESD
ncbi:Hypothetical predicted protein [Mytilus galloprovincialis]|uniref:Fibronectin type-III domain-containing protein n=1 Tax=Mytilus galloprovincialis TaxID=29158 RepID=A0A8B6HCN3_MYTGA|nr:Hypothetical predicted protein [Mytilus galloprovincialis]